MIENGILGLIVILTGLLALVALSITTYELVHFARNKVRENERLRRKLAERG